MSVWIVFFPPAPDFLHFDFRRFVVEIFVFFTEPDAFERPCLPPVFHVSGHRANHWPNLPGGQQPLGLQPSKAALYVISAAESLDRSQIEQIAAAGAPTPFVENGRDFALAMLVRLAVDLRDNFRLGLLQFPGGLGWGQAQLAQGAATKAKLRNNLLIAPQHHIAQ